jgi:hypothetical protein
VVLQLTVEGAQQLGQHLRVEFAGLETGECSSDLSGGIMDSIQLGGRAIQCRGMPPVYQLLAERSKRGQDIASSLELGGQVDSEADGREEDLL